MFQRYMRTASFAAVALVSMVLAIVLHRPRTKEDCVASADHWARQCLAEGIAPDMDGFSLEDVARVNGVSPDRAYTILCGLGRAKVPAAYPRAPRHRIEVRECGQRSLVCITEDEETAEVLVCEGGAIIRSMLSTVSCAASGELQTMAEMCPPAGPATGRSKLDAGGTGR